MVPKEGSVSPVSPSDRTVETFSLGQLQRGLVHKLVGSTTRRLTCQLQCLQRVTQRHLQKTYRYSLFKSVTRQSTNYFPREAEASPPKEVHSSTLKDLLLCQFLKKKLTCPLKKKLLLFLLFMCVIYHV